MRSIVLVVSCLATLASCLAVAGIDGYTKGDDAPDVASDGPDASTSFCASRPDAAFCVEFENDADIGARWSFPRATGSSTLRLDSLAASGLSSLATRLDTTEGCGYADLTKQVPAPVREMRLEAKLLLAADGDGTLFTLSSAGASGDSACGFLFRVATEGAHANVQRVVDGGQFENSPLELPPVFAVGRWASVAAELAPAESGVALRLWVDGNLVLERTPLDAAILANCRLGGPAQLTLGFHCATGVKEAHFDDVALEYR